MKGNTLTICYYCQHTVALPQEPLAVWFSWSRAQINCVLKARGKEKYALLFLKSNAVNMNVLTSEVL